MTSAEIIFILLSFVFFTIFVVWKKNISWAQFGFIPKPWWRGWPSILVFSIFIFFLIQILGPLLELPAWVTDKDPLLPLLVIVFIQEIIFRGLVINWLERWGKQRALWGSVVIFVMFHLVAPYTWTSTGLIFAGLTLIAGYFWGWHFLKFRNIYLLAISHFVVNLSFNYMIFSAFF